MSDYQQKLQILKDTMRKTGGCAIAFSGGVDSSLLLAVASEVLGQRCLAVIATSSTYPQREYKAAIEWVEKQNIPHVVVVSEELDIPEFVDNPTDRCYYCKRELMAKVRQQANAHGLPHIAHGANADDVHDFRPGMRAAREVGALSPLKDAGLTKEDIRTIARDEYHLPVADKPAMACLSSRFPYGSKITREKLQQVENMENYLFDNGFRVVRARNHGDMVRLELGVDEMLRMHDIDIRQKCVSFAKSLGFIYVVMDLEGFRSGSMNEVLQIG
ncbi:MAG: ATP-dependent sacrificial sulfur transferase LarE [Armatimonadota bacterium]